MISAAAKLTQNCAVCRCDPEARARWGCDKETANPQFFMDCHACAGADESCSLCRGQGIVPVHRCPHAIPTAQSRQALLMCSLARNESGHLPVAGGWLDQSATLLQAMQIVEDEHAKHRDDVSVKK